MKKIRLTETELTNIIKKVIEEQSSIPSDYVVSECEAAILMYLNDYLDKATEDAKAEIKRRGGKFTPPITPTDEDWEEASINVLRRFK